MFPRLVAMRCMIYCVWCWTNIWIVLLSFLLILKNAHNMLVNAPIILMWPWLWIDCRNSYKNVVEYFLLIFPNSHAKALGLKKITTLSPANNTRKNQSILKEWFHSRHPYTCLIMSTVTKWKDERRKKVTH